MEKSSQQIEIEKRIEEDMPMWVYLAITHEEREEAREDAERAWETAVAIYRRKNEC